MFEYRYQTSGSGAAQAKDFPMNATYATTAQRGDAVKLNASGEIVAAVAADTAVLGVLVGFNFEGIDRPIKTGKVHVNKEFVYEVNYTGTTKSSLTNADIGTAFDIGANPGVINLDATTVKLAKVIGFNNTKKTAYVQLDKLIFN